MKKIVSILFIFIILITYFGYAVPAQPVIGEEISTRNPVIYNVSIAASHFEYSQALPDVHNLTFQCRSAFPIRYSFVTGKVGSLTSPYMTLKSGDVFNQHNINISSTTLYIAATQSGIIVEIEKW